jgi:uncharacterized Rossmann fold enzyme
MMAKDENQATFRADDAHDRAVYAKPELKELPLGSLVQFGAGPNLDAAPCTSYQS